MRITGGVYRSRKLETPKNDAVRPTSDKVRLAVFNMLKSRGAVQDAIVIDAFCGTGALGLEALSQGAAQCVFFDNSKISIELCKINVQNLKEMERADVLFQDASKLKSRPDHISKSNLVFLDPPYHKDLISQAVVSLHANDWLEEDAFLVMETAKDENIISELIQITDEKIYGDTKISLGLLKNSAVNQGQQANS